jgi:hypothetical protein
MGCFASAENTMTIRTRLALVSLCTVAFAACSGDSSGPPPVASVAVSNPGSDIIVGQTASLTATPKDAKGNTLTNRTVAWTSSSQTTATVSSTGVVTGVAPGGATITATVEGKTGTAIVNVVLPPVATVTVTAVSTTLQAGQTTQATAITRDASNTVVTGRALAWSTSNLAVATVSGTGVVTGLSAGTATITATSEGKAGTVDIAVTAGNPADAPQITAVTPNVLVEGQAATITGTKFGATADANVVRIGGVAASVTAVSATSLQIIVPDLNCRPAQNVNLDVTVAGNTSTPRSQSFTPNVAPFTLAQGQQRLISAPATFCLQFPAANGSESYLIGVQSISETVTNVTPVTVTGQAPVGAAAASQTSIAAAPLFSGSLFTPRGDVRSERVARHRAVESALIDQERALFSSRFRSVKGAARTSRASLSQVPTVPTTVKVGDVINIRVPNRNSPSTCQNFIPVAVTVKTIGQKGIFVEDNANPTGGFSATDYQGLSDKFDSQIYATDAGYFGVPTDQDNNSRVVIVITKEVNKITNLLGEVFTADLVTQQDCPSSNEGEFFYGRAPDPTGAAGAAYTVTAALEDAPIIIAHEFTHVIQLGRRLNYEPATAFQSTWELEGQATFAEEVNGYAATGLAPGQNLGFEVAFNNPASQPITWFADPFVDLVVYYGFLSQTSRAIGAPEQCSWLATRSQGNTGPCLTGREPYGVPWSFLRWLSDQYGSQFPGGEKGLHQRLVDNEFTGYATITSLIGQPIDVLLAQWAASLYTDDRVPNIDPKLTFKSWNLFAIEQRLVATAKLAPYDRPFGAFTDQISVRAGSSAYFRVSGSGRPATGIRIRDGSDLPLPGNMRVWVVRIQ